MPESLTLLKDVTLCELVVFGSRLSQNSRTNLPGLDVLLNLPKCLDKIPNIPLSESINFLNNLPPDIKTQLPELNDFPKLLACMDLLPEKLAPTGRVLKVTVYDFLNKKDTQTEERMKRNKADRSGTCSGFLFALDEGATVAEHEHPDNDKPTDTIEIYNPLTDDLIDHYGNALTPKLCSFGDKHGIGPMPRHSLVKTLKYDREHALRLLAQLKALFAKKCHSQAHDEQPEL